MRNEGTAKPLDGGSAAWPRGGGWTERRRSPSPQLGIDLRQKPRQIARHEIDRKRVVDYTVVRLAMIEPVGAGDDMDRCHAERARLDELYLDP